MFPGHTVVGYYIFTIRVVAPTFEHRGHKFFPIFLVPGAQLRCRVVVVVKLQNCRVPSSAYSITVLQYSTVKSETGGGMFCLRQIYKT